MVVPNTPYYGLFKSYQSDFICFSLKLGLIVLVISNQPRAMHSANLKLLAQLLFILSIFKSLVILAICLALSNAIYSQIALYYALNGIFSSQLF